MIIALYGRNTQTLLRKCLHHRKIIYNNNNNLGDIEH
jgi:hypothetical protein